MPVRNVVAVPPEVVDCRARVRLLPVPAWIVILDAPPVMLPTEVKLPVTSADPLNPCPHRLREVVSVAALPVVDWLSVGNVQLVSVPDVGVPRTGVTIVRLVQVPVGV